MMTGGICYMQKLAYADRGTHLPHPPPLNPPLNRQHLRGEVRGVLGTPHFLEWGYCTSRYFFAKFSQWRIFLSLQTTRDHVLFDLVTKYILYTSSICRPTVSLQCLQTALHFWSHSASCDCASCSHCTVPRSTTDARSSADIKRILIITPQPLVYITM